VTARTAALDILGAARERQGFVGDLLDGALADSPLSPPDRRFLTQLAFGVSRRHETLDALVAPCVQRPLANVEPVLLDILRLGAYQLVFLTQVPARAAVHESVELAAYAGKVGAKGFVNGVLRRVAELVTDDFTESPAADAVPVDGGRYRGLTRPLLPDPRAYPAAYLAEAFSWPDWLARRWLDRHGPAECFRLAAWFQSPPPTWLRVNELRTTRADYAVQLAAVNVGSEPGDHPQSLRLTDGVAIRTLPGYAEGEFAVQDHSSMLVASALGVKPGMRVLDLCAAPGGKATHLAELMRDRGKVVACDTDAARLATVAELAKRLGLTCVETVALSDGSDAPAGPFDAALVDAPCSNTGVLGRRPEVRRRLQPREFPHLIRLQLRLLRTAIDRVKPGGAVVYSTCSIEPDENRGVVDSVIRSDSTLTLEADHTAIPGLPSDGGYWARLRKG
jgi:16S rRNA (cytosine967-C5)-methyltransferase